MSYIKKPKILHQGLARNALGLTLRDYEGSMSTLAKILAGGSQQLPYQLPLILRAPNLDVDVKHFRLQDKLPRSNSPSSSR